MHSMFYVDFLLHNKKISHAERLEKIDGTEQTHCIYALFLDIFRDSVFNWFLFVS